MEEHTIVLSCCAKAKEILAWEPVGEYADVVRYRNETRTSAALGVVSQKTSTLSSPSDVCSVTDYVWEKQKIYVSAIVQAFATRHMLKAKVN